MRRKILLLMILVFFLLTIANPYNRSVEQESEPYCKVENAIITYEYYGLDKGTVKLYIKDNGSFVRREDTKIVERDGGEKTLRFFYLLTPEYFYQADLHDSNMAVRMPRPANQGDLMILIHEILHGEQAKSLETEKRYKKEAEERVVNQLCKVYYDETSAEKFWIWNDIILKQESLDWETKEPSGKRAVSVELNPKFEKDTFELPKDLEIIG